MDDRRRTQRKRILLEAKWESMSRSHEARVDDVSLGGCFVNTSSHVELNEPVNLQLQLPSGEWLTMSGKVASYLPNFGFGVCFDPLGEKEEKALKKLIDSIAE